MSEQISLPTSQKFRKNLRKLILIHRKFILITCKKTKKNSSRHNVPFPPLGGWTVLEDDVFETYLPASSPTETTMGTLVQISPEGVFSGNFRLVLAGDRSIKGQIMASHLLAVPGASSYRLSIEMRPEEISFRSNGVTSDWFDADQR